MNSNSNETKYLYVHLCDLARYAGLENDRRVINARHALAQDWSNPDTVKFVKEVCGLIQQHPRYIRACQASQLPFSKYPNPRTAFGEIRIGSIRNLITGETYPAGLGRYELAQHTGIFSRTGGGKTVFLLLLLVQLIALKIPFLIFDFFKREYRTLLHHGDVYILRWDRSFKFNPFQPPPGVDFMTWLMALRDIFFELFFSSYPAESSRAVFFDIALETYRKKGSLNFFDFVSELRKRLSIQNVHSTVRERIRTLLNRLEPMAHVLKETFDCDEGYPFDFLSGQNCIIEMDGLGADYQNFMCSLLMHWRYLHALNHRGCGMRVIVVDEGHRIFHGGNVFIENFVRLSRALELALIYANQTLDIDHCVLANTYTMISLSIASGKDRSLLASHMGLNADQEEYLGRIPSRRAIVRTVGKYPFPYLVDIPETRIDSGVSESEVAEYMEVKIASLSYKPRKDESGSQELSERQTDVGKDKNDKKNILLTDDEDSVLKYKRRNPFTSEKFTIKSLSMSNHKGIRLFKSLMGKGMLSEVPIRSFGKGRPQIFHELTPEAEKIVGLQDFGSGGGKGGLAHVWHQRQHREYFLLKNFMPEIEEYWNGKATDLGISKNNLRGAIEFACSNPGKELGNIIKDYEAGWRLIYVLCSTQSILDAVKSDWEAVRSQYPSELKVEFGLIYDSKTYLRIESDFSSRNTKQGGETENN